MSYFRIEWWFASVILSALSLRIAPDFWLFPWTIWGSLSLFGVLLSGILFKLKKLRSGQFSLAASLCLAMLGYMQHAALSALTEAKQVAALPSKVSTQFRIEEIQHQQDYQAVVIRAKLAEHLPEQRLYARLQFNDEIKLGDIWQGELKLRAMSSRLNQDGFDRQQWYFSKGISGYATIKSAVKIREDLTWRTQLFYQAKQQTENLPQQGLLLALGFGERAWLPATDWQIYQQTNTAHLIAISGLHIGLAMLLGFGLARAMQIVLPIPLISPYFPLIIGTLCAVFYAQLAGFSIPTFRAVMALLVILLLRYCRYYFTPWRLFGAMVSLLLLCDPLMVLSSSFLLSVGAVASLILWYQLFPLAEINWLNNKKLKPLKGLIALCHLQLGLFWLFMPLQLGIFGGFSFYGLLANLVVVPFFSFVLVPLVLFAIVTQGSLWSWQLADWLAQQILQVLSVFDQGWIWLDSKTQWILTALFALLLLWRLLATRKVKRHGVSLYVLSSGLMLYALINWAFAIVKPEQWRIETLDVGQGLATLLVKNGHGILYDTGAAWQNGSMAELEILPYLRREGIVLDKLILSHDDNDHAGGAFSILNAFPQVELITPSQKNDVQNAEKTDRTFCVKGRNWQWQGLDFRVLSPLNVVAEAENPDSCVILVSDGKWSLLLTGDADVATEQIILPELNKINVLQVGHHGSKTSTSLALVNKLQPEIALISSGRWNPWRFPHHSVVERLEQAKSAVYNTAVSGQISVIFTAEERRVETARHQWQPWYRQLMVP